MNKDYHHGNSFVYGKLTPYSKNSSTAKNKIFYNKAASENKCLKPENPTEPIKNNPQKSPPSKNPSAPSCSELLRVLPKNPHPSKNPSAPSCSECSQKIPTPQKIRVLQAAPSAPKKAIVQKSPPSKSELLRVLRVLKKSYRQKIHHPQKIRVLRAAPSAPKKAIAPKKSPPKAPHPLPIF